MLVALVLVQAALWWWLTPPWAAPDEPGHFLYTQQLVSAPDADLEAELGRSLWETRWWQYNHLDPPPAPPTRLTSDPTLAASGSQIGQEPPLFYALAGRWWSLNPVMANSSPAVQLRWLRLASLLLRLLTLAVILLGLNATIATEEQRLGAALLVGLLPMVGFIGGSHNNDVLSMLWGSLAFLAVLRARHAPSQALATLLVLVGPLWVDRNLLFLWPFAALWALFTWTQRRSLKRAALLAVGITMFIVLLPNPRWASGWRRTSPAMPSRDQGMLLLPQTPTPFHLAQTLSDKTVVLLRDQPLRLQAIVAEPNGSLRLRIGDDAHRAEMICSRSPCALQFTVSPDASYIHIEIGSAQPPVHFRLSLRDMADRELLFNGDGSQPATWGNALFPWLERHLPVPAEFFDRALAPSAWDAVSQLRYGLFAGFMWLSFWGWFGWLSRPYPWWMMGLWLLLSTAAAWGLGHRLLDLLPRLRQHRLHTGDRLVAAAMLATGWLLLQIALPMVGQAWQPQGRYLLPGILPLAILLYEGWRSVWPRRYLSIFWPVMTMILLLANVVAWKVVGN